MKWVLLDDGGGDLGPLCDLRASFELRTGAVTTLERWARFFGSPPAALFVPEGLQALVASRHDVPVNRLPEGEGDRFVLVNGRWLAPAGEVPQEAGAGLGDAEGGVLAACLDRASAEPFLALGVFPAGIRTQVLAGAAVLRRPWDVLRHSAALTEADLCGLIVGTPQLIADPARGVLIVGDHPVHINGSATVHPHVVFDNSAGPILIDRGASVRSMAVIVGPAYIGPDSVVCNHAHIRAGTAIGPSCKVGGEVSACIFQGHANKAHSGYLGNSYVGEWVNLGADTVTSNLKNTYGTVRMQITPQAPSESTGMQFLGSMIGDHVKTAIGTRLLTGSCIHTGAMVAVSGFAPKYADRFEFMTDSRRERYDLERFLHVAEQAMRRRDLPLSPPMRQRIAALHAGVTGRSSPARLPPAAAPPTPA